MYFLSLQCKEGGFPHDLWLSVSAENVSVYKRGEPKPLETFPYEHIIFFGAPQPCTYKITVDEREMFFETPQVPHQNFINNKWSETNRDNTPPPVSLMGWWSRPWLSALCVRFQVAEITKIMKAYINMIVKKRCSVKSVSSFGSNWIRWLRGQDTAEHGGRGSFTGKHRDTVLNAWWAPDPLLILISYTGHFLLITWNLIHCLNNQEAIDGVCFLSLLQSPKPN